jgi:hypothetical protein
MWRFRKFPSHIINIRMAKCDRFADSVLNQRNSEEYVLKATISKIGFTYVRFIVKGIDETRGKPATIEKTDIDKAKAFLYKCFMTSSISTEVLKESSSYNFTGLSAEEIKKQLTESIQLSMKQLKAT